jgi:hypothetical protein
MLLASRRTLLLVIVALGWMSLVVREGFASVSKQTEANKAAGSQQIPPQTADGTKTNEPERPLPDIPALMHSVEVNQRTSEAIEKDYLYRSVVTDQQLDGHGGLKKTVIEEYEVFWVEGVPVHRLVKKNGKELSADDQKKESERIDKDAAKAKEKRAKEDEKGKESDARGNELMTASRALELGAFTNVRRVQLNGRDTIVADYAGDSKAKTRTKFEDVVKDLMGTVWIDEQDRVLVKAQGHFVNNFKVGGGLVVNIQKGTNFVAEWRKVNDEVWLPAGVEGQGSARALLFFGLNGRVQVVNSDYRKFKAKSTILPGMSTVQETPTPQ